MARGSPPTRRRVVASPSMPRDHHAVIPGWAEPFLRPARYKSARGGRASSKSHTFAQIAVLRMAGKLRDHGYPDKPVRIASARQFQVSIEESVKQAVEHYIRTYGLWGEFRVGKREINHSNGSHMWFPGFTRHPESLMSTEGLDVLWVEQAETIGEEMEKIIPSVRAPGSELWFTWNPMYRSQWCWRRFVTDPRPGDVSVLVNWNDNPWFPPEMEEERAYMQEHAPDRYPHVWLGEPDDEGIERQVIPYLVARKCVEAYRKGLAGAARIGPVNAGMDVADGGEDQNAVVVRAGPVIRLVDQFPSTTPGDFEPAATRAMGHVRTHAATTLWFDASGVGSTMGKEINRLRARGSPGAPRRVLAGQKPGGADEYFDADTLNGDMFFNRAAQLAWGLKMRAENTVRLLRGENVDPNWCLFIDPDCAGSERGLEAFLIELSQPRWEYTTKRAIRLLKQDDGEPSPDRFDAATMSFGRDSEHTGLRLRVPTLDRAA